MRLSITQLTAVLILLVGIPYFLVRLDVIEAEWLRLVPALAVLLVGVNLLLPKRRHSRKGGDNGPAL